jgi:drug/metabolite transporter (DMT)-like permease
MNLLPSDLIEEIGAVRRRELLVEAEIERRATQAGRALVGGELPTGRSGHGVVLAALGVVLLWGTNFVFLKAIFAEFDVFPFLFVRFLGVVVLAWAIVAVRWRRGGLPVRIERADRPRVALAGILGFSIYTTLSMVGLDYTTAFSNALLLATAPMFATLLLRALRAEPIAPGQWPAMALAFGGVALFLGEKVRGGWPDAGLGDLISLAAAFFFAAFNVANRPLLARYPASVVLAWTLTVGAAPVVLAALPRLPEQEWSAISPAAWLVVGWSTVMPVYVAYAIWTWVNHRDGVARTALFIYLVPIVGGIASWLLLDEGFGLQKVVGALLTIGGLVLARRAAGRGVVRPRPDARGIETAD